MKCLKRSLDIADIKEIESAVHVSLPTQYKNHITQFNGGYPVKKVFVFKMGDKSNASDVDWFYSICPGADDDLFEIIKILKIDEKRMPNHIVPIAHDSGGNQICISCSGDDEGKIYFGDHENEVDYTVSDDSDYSNLHLIANSFDEFLDGLMTEEEYDAYEEAQKEKR